MKPNNPFLISGYHGPEFFCDREQEAGSILEALQNGRNVTLTAPRRMGKTGLIRHVFYRLKELQPDIVTFYLDIYSTQSLGDFVRLFAGTVLGQLDSAPQKALSRISRFVRSCRPVFTFDELTGAPKVTIDVAPAEEENTLKEIFEYLGSSEKRCYVAIDEFQQIAAYQEKGVEALLRSHIQFLPNVNFIFAGSRQHLMQEMFTSSKRPFYQSTQMLTIGPIQQDEYAGFATGHFAAHGVKLPQEVFNRKIRGAYLVCAVSPQSPVRVRPGCGHGAGFIRHRTDIGRVQLHIRRPAESIHCRSGAPAESYRQGGLRQGGSGRRLYQHLQTSGSEQRECSNEEVTGK